jgi:hypothetical protein
MMAVTASKFLVFALECRANAEHHRMIGNEMVAAQFEREFNNYVDAYEKLTGENLNVERYE